MILDNVVREGLSEETLLSRILNKEKKQALQMFDGKAFRAEETASAKSLRWEVV